MPSHKFPLVGITPQYNMENNSIWLPPRYTSALLNVGLIPVIMEQTADPEILADLVSRLDGILFSGGPDIHPKYYGEDVHPDCGTIADARDTFELAIYRETMKRNLPTLGICRGIQFLNVAEGGPLYQHVPGHSDGVRHTVKIKANSLLAKITGMTETETNSYHHQTVKTPAPACVVTAAAEDGSVEALEKTDAVNFWLGVQWHPELMQTEESAIRLFRAFGDACREYMEKK
ncbi:MAG: gamma-glutamyl-gamma-aminobutyrate hydrolase family protein [Clostridia bacterium]|nr:gamma-glutamyl-gamma-aminobutyrate hydrolase family protein [Clostridia bacterium]